MFGSSAPISPALEVCPTVVDAILITMQFGSPDPNQPPPVGIQEQHQDASYAWMIDVEGPQGLGDIFTPNLIDDRMHYAHAEVGLGQGLDT